MRTSVLSATALLAGVLAVLVAAPASIAASRGDDAPSQRTRAGHTIAAAWPQPPPVLPLPSRDGPEGPPRPYGVQPAPGPGPPHTGPRWARAQDQALLYGPFPRDGLTRAISDGVLLLSEHAQVRAGALTRIAATGARMVRIPVNWREVVSATPPADFDARDPASPAYRFGLIDAAVSSTVSAGLTPLLVVSHAPAFAEAPHRWLYAYPGSWAPSPGALEAFAVALARRYDGSFPAPLQAGRTLPRVDMFQAWNEPNLARYLEPQWVVARGRWSAFSPLLYRRLLNAFYVGVHSVHPQAMVVAAGVAPNGDPAGVGRMAPVTFLRGMLCLAGAGAHCTAPPRFDALAFHPVSIGDPDAAAKSSLDVSIADAAKLTRLLRQAERRHDVLPAGPHPVWVTELNWESAPPSSHGVPARLQARWISRALHRLWIAGSSLVAWQFLIDPYPGLLAATPTGGTFQYPRPAGLYSAIPGGDPASARPKPFLRGFTLPFDPLRVDRRHVRVWALLMRPRQPVLLQRLGQRERPERGRRLRRGGQLVRGERRWRTIARLHADRHGVLNVLIRLTGAAQLRVQIGSLSSAPSLVPRG